MDILGMKLEPPRLPSLDQVRGAVGDAVGGAVQAGRELGSAAIERARDLGQAGVDLGRRAVADPEGTVRALAADAKKGIGEATEAVKGGVRDTVMATGRGIGAVADTARGAIKGDGAVANFARGAIDAAEHQTRFTVGVVGGIVNEGVGLVGTAASVGVTVAEMQVSSQARAEVGQAIATGLERGGQAVSDYARAVAADPSRVAGDLASAGESVKSTVGGFLEGQVERHQQAYARGEGPETAGMTTGAVASNFIPFGAVAKGAANVVRGADALTTVARGADLVADGTRVALRQGGEAVVREGTQAATREASEAGLRAAGTETRVTNLAPTAAAREAAEAGGAKLVAGAQAGGGTVRVAHHGGVTAQDLAAASRQSGGEVALYRDLATGDRYVTIGTQTGATIPEGSRLIAHTQPGTGAAAVRPSIADEAALTRLDQRSSVIIDQGGTAATRFRPTEAGAEVAQTQRVGDAIEINASKPSLRDTYMGGTPDKFSKTGASVVDRMRAEGKIVGEGKLERGNPNDLKLVAESGDEIRIDHTIDMAHKTDAVSWWNTTGRLTGAKSAEVREFMLDPDNYMLQPRSINRAEGARLGEGYLPPVSPDFAEPK